MLQMRLQDEANQRLLGVMQANAERGAEMVKPGALVRQRHRRSRVAIQSKHLIREIVKIMEETFPTFHMPEALWATIGDATQLQQVLMNLCVNARDAMLSGGELTIMAENQATDEIYAGMLRGARAGNFVAVTVTDTGRIPLKSSTGSSTRSSPPKSRAGHRARTGYGSRHRHRSRRFITVESKLGREQNSKYTCPPTKRRDRTRWKKDILRFLSGPAK